MTVYGPATGHYSRDSIRQARASGGKKGARILDADKKTAAHFLHHIPSQA